MNRFFLLIFIVLLSCNNKINKIDINKYDLKVHNDTGSLNIDSLVNKKNINYILFFNQYTCEKCFEKKLPFIKKFNKQKKLIIVGNFKNFRELYAFKNSFGLINCYRIDSSSLFPNFSFFYNFYNKKYVPINTNNDILIKFFKH